jgi:hypothetical protein
MTTPPQCHRATIVSQSCRTKPRLLWSVRRSCPLPLMARAQKVLFRCLPQSVAGGANRLGAAGAVAHATLTTVHLGHLARETSANPRLPKCLRQTSRLMEWRCRQRCGHARSTFYQVARTRSYLQRGAIHPSRTLRRIQGTRRSLGRMLLTSSVWCLGVINRSVSYLGAMTAPMPLSKALALTLLSEACGLGCASYRYRARIRGDCRCTR